MRFVIAALVGAGLIMPVAAGAQDFSGPLSPGAFETTLNMGPIANTLRQQMHDTPRTTRQPLRAAPKTPSAPAVTTRYVVSKARRSANLAAFLAKARRTNAASAESLAQIFAQGDFIQQIQGKLTPYGLRVDDVADAYAVWWMNTWGASHGITDTPNKRTIAAVKAQAAGAIAATTILRGASDAAKQELAESLLIQATLIDAAQTQSVGKPDEMRKVAAVATANGRTMGLDLPALALTDHGFVPAGQAD